MNERSSTNRRGADLDRLAVLEEERDHLLRSIRDLERELEAGDIDTTDHATLRDGYTVRTADVLREIDTLRVRLGLAEPVDGSTTTSAKQDPAERARRRRRLLIGWSAAVVLAVAMGFALASAFGERRAGQVITGSLPGDDVRVSLVEARLVLGNGDFAQANQLFFEADLAAQEAGEENAEARAYFGWTLALIARGEADAVQAERLTDAAVLALSQAAEIEPRYPDPRCFLAIVEFQFRGDAEAALPHIEFCEANNPPAEVAGLVAAFADEIRASL